MYVEYDQNDCAGKKKKKKRIETRGEVFKGIIVYIYIFVIDLSSREDDLD